METALRPTALLEPSQEMRNVTLGNGILDHSPESEQLTVSINCNSEHGSMDSIMTTGEHEQSDPEQNAHQDSKTSMDTSDLKNACDEYELHAKANGTCSKTSEDKRVRKFICRYCSKAFSLMNVLKVHERIHTGEKPYVCEICDKAFNQSGSLNRHKNTHMKRNSDNRSYSCHHCSRQFLHSSQLQEHEASEHGYIHRARNFSQNDSCHNISMTLNNEYQPNTEACNNEEKHTAPERKTNSDSGSLFPLNDTSRMIYPTLADSLNLPRNSRHVPRRVTEKSDTNAAKPFNNMGAVYPCAICGQNFTSQSEFNKHATQHFLQQLGASKQSEPMQLTKLLQHQNTFSENSVATKPGHLEDLLNNLLKTTLKPDTAINNYPINPLFSPESFVQNASPDIFNQQNSPNLFQGNPATAAAAATTALLSQMLMNSPSQSMIPSNPFLLAFALANQELLSKEKSISQGQHDFTKTSAMQMQFNQLLNSINNRTEVQQSENAVQFNEKLLLPKLNEQGLNLTTTEQNPLASGNFSDITDPVSTQLTAGAKHQSQNETQPITWLNIQEMINNQLFQQTWPTPPTPNLDHSTANSTIGLSASDNSPTANSSLIMNLPEPLKNMFQVSRNLNKHETNGYNEHLNGTIRSAYGTKRRHSCASVKASDESATSGTQEHCENMNISLPLSESDLQRALHNSSNINDKTKEKLDYLKFAPPKKKMLISKLVSNGTALTPTDHEVETAKARNISTNGTENSFPVSSSKAIPSSFKLESTSSSAEQKDHAFCHSTTQTDPLVLDDLPFVVGDLMCKEAEDLFRFLETNALLHRCSECLGYFPHLDALQKHRNSVHNCENIQHKSKHSTVPDQFEDEADAHKDMEKFDSNQCFETKPILSINGEQVPSSCKPESSLSLETANNESNTEQREQNTEK